MIVTEIIGKTRDGDALSQSEMTDWIQAYSRSEVTDYQMSAWAMAVYLNGLSPAEIQHLTTAMLNSGTTLRRVSDRPRVDKHSTGGLGDKVSLIIAPLLACMGLEVPMISGRGLGFTGGTLDKLEAIPGYRTNLTVDEIESQLRAIGCVVTGASENIVPADRKLYSLRDVTGTVSSIPLITSSILSKKAAESLDALVLDVKWGSGAFMSNHASAKELAHSLQRVGGLLGIRTTAILSDMNQPLGRMVGNSCEVMEVLQILEGDGPQDLLDLTLELAAILVDATTTANSTGDSRHYLRKLIDNGQARERFEQMVASQSGKLESLTPLATRSEFAAKSPGYLQAMNCRQLGNAVIELGGGRKRSGEPIRHDVGLECLVRIGDHVDIGQPLLHVFGDSNQAVVQTMLESAFDIRPEPPQSLPLLFENVESE